MTTSALLPSPSRRQAGFSLLELMAVMAVVAFLMALAAPNLIPMLQGSEMSTQGDLLRNQLSLAQQRALSTNADVEVRFYQFADGNKGDVEPRFRAMQLFQYNEEGKKVAISEIFRLRGGLAFSQKFSNLLDSFGKLEASPDGRAIFGSGVTSSVNYRSFRFKPDGSTDLTRAQDTWYITLVKDVGVAVDGQLPDNFFTIQIDAFNGSLREFRP